MRIAIDVSAANDPDAHRWLDRILHRIEDGWHVWDLSDARDADAIGTTTWINDPGRQGDRLRDLLVAATRRSAWTLGPHTRRLRVTARPDPVAADELAPEQASQLADERLVILVENRESDGAFVARVVAELDRSLHDLWQRDGEPIRFDSVGGKGQMPREVERRATAVPHRPRLVAVIDSDRKHPGDSESRDARRLRATCEEHGLPCWVLAKREAENYLPRVLLAARPNAGVEHLRKVEAWERLSEEQKDFFDMKRGLRPRRPARNGCAGGSVSRPRDIVARLVNLFRRLPRAPTAIEEDLFANLAHGDRETLVSGFGPNVHACWSVRLGQEVRNEVLARGQGDLKYGIELIRREL